MRAMVQVLASIRRDLETAGAAGIALLVVFLGVVTNRYRLESLPLRPHLEHVAILFALAVLAWLVWRRRVRLSFQFSDLLLGAYLAVALVSSLLFPPDPRESVQYWARMVLAVLVYFIVRALMSQQPGSNFRLALKALLLFGVIQALFGIVSWFLYPLGINLGVDEYPLGIRGPGGILCNFSLTMYGTLWEPNVFGSTLMLIVLVASTLFVSNEFVARRKSLGIALVILLVAIGLNASRGAMLTLALGLALVVLLARGMSLYRRAGWATAAALLLVLVNVPTQELSRVLMQLPSAPGLAARAPCAGWIAAGMPRATQQGDPAFDPSTGPESDFAVVNRMLEGQTLASRWVSYSSAWNDFLARPVLGNGANSFGQKYTTTARTPGWISNLVLMSLHDTGIIGTIILSSWFGWFALKTFRALPTLPPRTHTLALALSIGLVCLFLAYQVTTLLWFGLMWYFLAILQMGTVREARLTT